MPELDRLIGGVIPGDNIVWEVDSGAPVGLFVSSFISACEAEGSNVVYVSFNRSPQTILEDYGDLMSPGRFTLVDCFSSGKGNGDEVFLEFFRTPEAQGPCRALHVENPADPAGLQEMLARISSEEGARGRYLFDSLTGMLDLWGDEDKVLRFFGHICPRLYDLGTIACWLLETEAHSQGFLAKVRHITQVVIEVAVAGGVSTMTVRKAMNRQSREFGVPQRFEVEGDRVVIAAESRADRELGLLTRMGEALDSALDPTTFFEQTMDVLADELGMFRGTLVLLDRMAGKLRIAGAHGLSGAERSRGEYAVGEGVTGRVVETGEPEVVPDIAKDPRFLDRTAARRAEAGAPVAFICVPLRVDGEVVGALSVDRPLAVQSTLDKDLRLLTVVASTVSQVIKINRMARVEKEEILARDERLLGELKSRYQLEKIAGQSEAAQRMLATAAAAAKSRASILITGETGTGKELIANVVHYNSDRAKGPLVKVNCGALPETLLESELFGHVKGAFTGAVRDRKGRFKLADGGTLFLDEVAEMSPRLQVKLLRVLQEMEFEPVGAAKTVHVDVRVVAATNKDLKVGIREGWLREDLYYRLNVIPIHVPALRERRDDIPLLVDHFLELYNERNAKSVTKLSRDVLDLLLRYDWPGNVRELENCIERAVVMAPGEMLSVDILPDEVKSARPGRGRRRAARPPAPGDETELVRIVQGLAASAPDLAEVRSRLMASVEKSIIAQAVADGTSQRELARKLGMSRMTLRKKMREYDIA
jgi:Nif-specific regulatory protein